ncbi:hypothetical protein [Paludisphaera mucosa]|uniref:Uncharacterized protein n=1 Tax=Paludisphaera mucosa TaxID=3030827 RepID=A0ABT6FLI3_9BACT|nr:hypothetical protein [Paludisphaera mucosa]MDG3008438.1 hypothetical protein [Paludisphaera mucosa]
MTDTWYSIREPQAKLTQGDIITECPLLTWETPKADAGEALGPTPVDSVDRLSRMAEARKADVVVMTQACDLAQSKVSNVVLCPCLPLSKFKVRWEDSEKSRNQVPSPKAWKRLCDDIKDGYMWNLFMMDSLPESEITTEHRIVDFHAIFTVPRTFIETLLVERGAKRLSLLPPYREHLSQSFARYFMRVGLPQNIKPVW